MIGCVYMLRLKIVRVDFYDFVGFYILYIFGINEIEVIGFVGKYLCVILVTNYKWFEFVRIMYCGYIYLGYD